MARRTSSSQTKSTARLPLPAAGEGVCFGGALGAGCAWPLPPPFGACAVGEAAGWCAARAGLLLGTARVSNATRLMSIRCQGETLSEVTLPPHDPQPRVIEGGSAVEKPMAPCVVGELTMMREAGISTPNAFAASRERVWMPAVWPMPP